MRILIAEDEAVIAESLYQVLHQLEYDALEPAANSQDAINNILSEKPDMAIVDIHLAQPYAGFKVAYMLNQKDIPFIFLTALYDKDTVERAKEFNPAAYLVKPFNKENLFATIELAASQRNINQKQSIASSDPIFIKNGAKHVGVIPAEITYLETEGGYVKLYSIKNTNGLLVRTSLKELMDELQLASLVQVHKSFVVNTNFIKAVKYDELIVNDTVIPVGRSYREELKKVLSFFK
jgi:two-component system, LytTR family, response regulator LytT